MHEIEVRKLDKYIASFLVNVRQGNGQEYEPTTLRNMQSSFERHLRLLLAHTCSQSSMKLKCQDLKSQGKGNLEHARDPLTEQDISKL